MDGIPTYVEPTDKEKIQQEVIKDVPRVLRFFMRILYEIFRITKNFIADSIQMIKG